MHEYTELENKVEYNFVEHPTHYNTYDVETVEMINKIWGPFLASKWCELNAFKYRMRMGTKPGEDVKRDIQKENVYLSLYRKYREQWRQQDIIMSNVTEEEKEYLEKILSTLSNKK